MSDADFFRYSNLANNILIEVWRLASLGERQLSREQFYVAMKLVSLAQQNQPINIDLITQPLPIPQFYLPTSTK